MQDDAQLQYEIRTTSYGGRSAFAFSKIPKGTLVLSCAAPYDNVVLRKFRKEVCSWCFAYSFESGKRKWSVRLEDSGSCGRGKDSASWAWFCGLECRQRWMDDYGGAGSADGVGLWVRLNDILEKNITQENQMKKKNRNAAFSLKSDGSSSTVTDTFPLGYLDTLAESDTSLESIDRAWKLSEQVFSENRNILVNLRHWNLSSEDKTNELLTEFEIDCVRFVLDGLIRRALQAVADSTASPSVSPLCPLPGPHLGAGSWKDLLDLQNNELPYIRSRPSALATFIRIYAFVKHVIHSAIPRNQRSSSKQQCEDPSLTPLLANLIKNLETSDSVRAILSRDQGNTFGIWEKADDAVDSEMLGWSTYSFGSYFNHDCRPNLKKRQHGRSLQFYTTRDVEQGEGLCINYIDVSENSTAMKRSEELEKDWFFSCQCERCLQERELNP